MTKIVIDNVLPDVFAGTRPASDVWLTGCTITRGEHVEVAAASGEGKSTLCAFLYGYRNDYSGSIRFDGEDISTFDIERWSVLRRRHLSYVPQDLRLFDKLTALENCMIKNTLTDHKTEREIRDMLSAIGLQDRIDYPAGRLSIGQRQRVAIVRALCQPMDVLLLDEPASHLDEASNRAAADMIAAEADRQGAAVVVMSVGARLLIDYSRNLQLSRKP